MRQTAYNLNQFIAVSVIPNTVSRRVSNTAWSKVSNAELKSKRISIERQPESAASSKSFVTLTNAVSVLWNL